MSGLWILGGGGHARVAIDAARSQGHTIAGILSGDGEERDERIDGVSIMGTISREVIRARGVSRAIVAVGDNQVRARLAKALHGLLAWETVVHDFAYVAPTAFIGAGTLVCAGAVVQPGARIGRHAVINTSSSVDHDCEIADFAQVGPGAHLGGEAVVETGAFIGIGSSILPRVRIGEWSKVGAGAVVIRHLPADVTAVGVPAHIISERDRPGEC